jgi:hypothetical protein
MKVSDGGGVVPVEILLMLSLFFFYKAFGTLQGFQLFANKTATQRIL